MGPGVTLINTGEEAAWELKRTLRAMDLLAPEGRPAGPPSVPATSPSTSGSWRPISWGKASPARCSRWTSTGTDPWRDLYGSPSPAAACLTAATRRCTFRAPGTLRPTAAGWDLPYTAACRENGAALSSRIRLTAEPRRAILWTLGPEGYGLPLDPEHETQARLPLGLTVAVRTRAVEFSLEEPDRGYIHLAYTLLDRGLPLSRMRWRYA